MITTAFVRSNIFLPITDEAFLKQESKSRGLKKGELISMGLKALKREKMRKAMEHYYAIPEHRDFESQMAEETFILVDHEG